MEKNGFKRDYCFTFFKDWLLTLNNIACRDGYEEAYSCFLLIAYYALYGVDLIEFGYSCAIEDIWPTIKNRIDASTKSRQKRFEELQNKNNNE